MHVPSIEVHYQVSRHALNRIGLKDPVNICLVFRMVGVDPKFKLGRLQGHAMRCKILHPLFCKMHFHTRVSRLRLVLVATLDTSEQTINERRSITDECRSLL